MILCDFFVAGDPVAQPRLRPRMDSSGRLGVHMPDTARAWRERVAIAGHEAWGKAPRTDALEVDLHFFFARPKSHFGARGALKGSAPAYHTVKPDRDNAEKAVADSLNGILWHDDAQIVAGVVTKNYVDEAVPEPGCLITVRSMP